MRKVLLIALFLLGALSAQAQQRPSAKTFREATDSLQQRLKRRTGVDTPLKLEKVTVRGSALDFYFSQELADYPWRQEDMAWVREQLQTLGKEGLGSYRSCSTIMPIIGKPWNAPTWSRAWVWTWALTITAARTLPRCFTGPGACRKSPGCGYGPRGRG